VKLVKRAINNETCCSVPLILAGVLHQETKNNISVATCGLDIGPSTIAVVSTGDAFLAQFCDGAVQPWKGIKSEQRAQDRSRRAINYNEDGTVTKGSRKWPKSNRNKRRQKRIAECQRTLAAAREKQHGELCNKIYNFGRSVMVRAPGMFSGELTRKAVNAGGSVEEIDTRKTNPSQTCICGKVDKKPAVLPATVAKRHSGRTWQNIAVTTPLASAGRRLPGRLRNRCCDGRSQG